MELKIRKLVSQTETVLIEGGNTTSPTWELVGVGAVIENPYAGRYVEDLSPMLEAFCAELGKTLTERVAQLVPEGPKVEAYGKAGIVGLNGEIEHASGILHNLNFGNPLRQKFEATSLLPSTEKRAAAGATVDVPLKHIHDHKVRSHHQTLEMRVGDAPGADEILIVIAVALSGRPHARIGEFGIEVPEDQRK